MRKDLPELAAYAVEKGMRAVISTNGTLISRGVAQTLKEIGLDPASFRVQAGDKTVRNGRRTSSRNGSELGTFGAVQ